MSGMIKVEVLRAACCVAGADGSSSEEERSLLDRLAKETGVGLASLEAMISRACCDQDFCNEQFRVLKAEPKETMAILLETAMADGQVSEAETGILRTLAEKLDVPDDVFDLLISKAKEISG